MKTESHKGAVCYIDLLGFSYLTNLLENRETYNDEKRTKSLADKCVKDLTLSDFRELSAYLKFENEDSQLFPNHQNDEKTIAEWAYDIVDANLKKFHEIVEKSCSRFQNVEYAAISDSMFIVSETSDEILFVLANIFRECIKSGILLRAGLSYGSYYSVKTHIAQFNVYGTAVTNAVSYEKLGKGCRIFTDSELPKTSEAFCQKNPALFSCYKNYQNYSNLDCFEWLMIKDDYVLDLFDTRPISLPNVKPELLNLLCDNQVVLCNLLYSLAFEWNLKTAKGFEQLVASVEYVSDLIDKIYGEFHFKKISNLKLKLSDGAELLKQTKRSDEILSKVINLKTDEIKNIFNITSNNSIE